MTATDRIFFEGHYHNDVFFEGRYHKEAWLNGELVWQKTKGEPVKYVSMLSYVNGKYYAVVESTKNMADEGFPILYEGKSLGKMHGRGRIFGDETVRGASYIMYADLNELTIIRTYMHEELTRHIARIPLNETGADMDNISYGMETGAYKFSNYTTSYRRYFYGNGNNYYYYDTREKAFFKNDNRLEEIIQPDVAVNEELIEIGTIGDFSSFGAYWQFVIMHGENEEFRTVDISLTAILEDACRSLGWNDPEIASVRISETGAYAMISNTVGYVHIRVVLNNKVSHTSYTKIYKIKVDFGTFEFLGWEDIGTDITYGVNSYMVGTGKHRVQMAVQKGQSGLSYGLIGEDYCNDVFIRKALIKNLPSYIRTDFDYYRICSLADNNDTLTIKIGNGTASVFGFIIVNVRNKTAEYKEIDIYAE